MNNSSQLALNLGHGVHTHVACHPASSIHHQHSTSHVGGEITGKVESCLGNVGAST